MKELNDFAGYWVMAYTVLFHLTAVIASAPKGTEAQLGFLTRIMAFSTWAATVVALIVVTWVGV